MSTAVDTASLQPGFDNPVLDSKQLSGLLSTLLLSGKKQRFDGLQDVPLMPATATFLLILADLDTSVWLDAHADVDQVKGVTRADVRCCRMRRRQICGSE